MTKATITFSQLFVILSLIISLCFTGLPARAAELIKVDALVISAANLNEAKVKARQQALERAFSMLGGRKIPELAKQVALADAERLVQINRILNDKSKPDGTVQPFFFCTVDKTALLDLIRGSQDATVAQLDRPQINIGIIFRTIPQNLTADQGMFIDRINNHLEEYFSAGGFRLAPPPAAMLKAVKAGRSVNEILQIFVTQATEVNYLLYGALDVNPEDLQAMDQGRYWKARVGLTLRFYNILSHDVVSFSRDVYGNGENHKASVLNAMRNCAKVISEKVAINDVIADWRRKLNEGFEYSLQFCAFHNPAWVKVLRRQLKDEGRFITRSRGQNITQIYRFKADPGRFIHPAIDFEDFLDEVDGIDDQVSFGLMVQNERLYFVFGDDEQCFDIGFAEAEEIK